MGVTYINPYRFGGFNPLSLSPALWLDASDTSTITASSGSVSQWNDKSGNGLNVTRNVVSEQPITGSRTVGGKNALDFDGVNDYLAYSQASNLGRNLTGLTVYTVQKYDISPTSQALPLWIATSDGVFTRIVTGAGAASGKALVGGRTLDSDGFIRVDSTSNVSTTAAQAQIGVFDYANTDLYIYLNNVLQGTNNSFQTATTSSNTTSGRFSVGSVFQTSPFDGLICEILVYHTAHSAAQRADVYNYLAAKWAL